MGIHDNTAIIAEIESMAARKNMAIYRFLRAVEMDQGLYHKWKRGEVRPRRDTMTRIRKRSRFIHKIKD